MSSTTGIKDGDFDRLNIAFDLGVGLDNDFGTNGQVLISGGENEPVRWGSNSATAPNPLRQGTNTEIVRTSDGSSLGTYDGSIDATIKTTDDISADEIRTDKLILPKVGTELIELDGSTGNIETTGTGEVLSIKNGGAIKLYSDAGGTNTMLIDANTGSMDILSLGKIITQGVSEIMRVNNGGAINLYDDNLGASQTIGIDGETGQFVGKTLLMNGISGTTTAVFTGNVDIDLSTDQNGDLSVAGDYSSLNGDITLTNGTITAGGLISGGSLTTDGNITATGTSGFIGVGTNADTYNILLNKDGTITCEDIDLENHTGTIEFDNIRCNDIGVPKTGTKTNYLNSDGLILTGSKNIDAPLSELEIKNIVVSGGLSTPNSAIICLGGLETGTDGSGNLGSVLLNTGDLTLTTGDTTLTAGDLTLTAGDLLLSSATSTATFKGEIDITGNSVLRGGADFVGDNAIDFIDSGSTLQLRIYPDTGNITNTNGKLTLGKAGTTPAPTDNTYTDWALNISNDDGHGYIGGNLIVNGKIYGDVEGNITEEVIDAQRINIRDGGVAGNTEINLIDSSATTRLSITDTGSIIQYDASGTLQFSISNSGNISQVQSITTYAYAGTTGLNFINSGTIRMNNGKITSQTTGGSKLELEFDVPRITLRTSTFTADRLKIEYDNIQLKDSNEDTSVWIEETNGVSVGDNNTKKITLNKDGDIEFLDDDSEIVGYKQTTGTITLPEDLSTNCKNLALDNSNYKYYEREIAIHKFSGSTPYHRVFNTTSTSWVDINNQLYINLKTDDLETGFGFKVSWNYYAGKDDGASIFAKLFDRSKSSPSDADQDAYLNETRQVIYFGNGATDFAGRHHTEFEIHTTSTQKSIDVNLGVAVWFVVNPSSPGITFFSGTGDLSSNPSASNKAYGGMTLQISRMYGKLGFSQVVPTGWSLLTADDY